MERKEIICSAYRMTGGNNFYDGMITCSTLSGKAVCRLVWAMNKAENDDYLEKALSGIPENFSGKLLEVPVGTGILTMPLYQTLPQADITCLDYSPDMMGQALENALRACRRMKAENGPAYIEVTAREKNGHLFLQFVNPCPEGIQFENGLPVTHAEGHGIGVRSICAIVEKYKGLSDFSVQDGRFILRVSL